MNSEEYANIVRLEDSHWFYVGKRAIARGWLERVGPPRPDQLLLDCGAGTGRFAKEMEARCRVLVLDDHEEALALLRARFRPDQVLRLAGDRVTLPDASLDYVTALDVLEHALDDRRVVGELHRLLKPGGTVVVTVPASMALWSDWDVALHHHRRYSRAQLRALFPVDRWETIHVNYGNVATYPAVWAVRRWRRLAPPRADAVRSEDRVPPRWLNAVLGRLFVATAFCRVPLPFGVSLILVARRRGAGP